MSRENSGYYVSWTDLDGTERKGLVKYKDQRDAFRKVQKVLVVKLNDDLSFMRAEEGKRIVTLKGVKSLKIIGYAD